MLILTRRVGETVVIGDDVTVTVLGVKGNQVRLGVNAPKQVAVHREEIYERIQREQDRRATQRGPGGRRGALIRRGGVGGCHLIRNDSRRAPGRRLRLAALFFCR